MRMLLGSLMLGLGMTTPLCAMAQAPSAAQYYQQLQQERVTKIARENAFSSGGQNIGGSVLRSGNTYEISPRRYAGEPQEIQVFQPMKNHLPQFLLDATAQVTPRTTLDSGVNRFPQFVADKNTYAVQREEAAQRESMFVPESVLAQWNAMWREVGHGQSKEVWGGTVTRFSNQVTYRAAGECQRGCTFSMMDSPMVVANRIPSIRSYWESYYTAPMNGDNQGIGQDPWARNLRPASPSNEFLRNLNHEAAKYMVSPIERTTTEPLSSWTK